MPRSFPPDPRTPTPIQVARALDDISDQLMRAPDPVAFGRLLDEIEFVRREWLERHLRNEFRTIEVLDLINATSAKNPITDRFERTRTTGDPLSLPYPFFLRVAGDPFQIVTGDDDSRIGLRWATTETFKAMDDAGKDNEFLDGFMFQDAVLRLLGLAHLPTVDQEIHLAALVAEMIVGQAWAASKPDDPKPQPDSLVGQLDAQGTAASGRLLEPFVGQVQRLLDDTSAPLEQFDENFIRSQIDAIRGWHRSGAAIPAQVANAIGLIVERLQETGHTENDIDAIRRRLEELEPEPESTTDEIIERFRAALDHIASLGSYTDFANLQLPATALIAAVDEIDDVDHQVEAKTKYRDVMKEEAAKSVGEVAGPTLKWIIVGATGTVAAAAASRAPTIVELLKILEDLLRVYTGG